MTARGPVLRCIAPVHVAVVGADPEVTVDGREVGAGHVVPLAAGQRLTVGAVGPGCAVRWRWPGAGRPRGAGERSTDCSVASDPDPSSSATCSGRRAAPGPMADHLAPGAPGARRGRRGRVLRVLPGPHGRWFPDDAFERLAGARFVVEAASDRVGVRLAPADAEPASTGGRESSTPRGWSTGAVQVPPGGRPVVLGPDHATVGGYPVVAVVAGCDRWLLGQCGPGDEVELAPVGPGGGHGPSHPPPVGGGGAVVGRYPSVPG